MARVILTIFLQLLVISLVQADELSDSLTLVNKECKSKLLNINSLDSFKDFMVHYRQVVDGTEKPKRGILNTDGGLRKCFDQKEQLFQLENLITHQNNGVCRLSYISKLVEYHLHHVTKSEKDSTDPDAIKTSSNPLRRTYAAYIFSLFAHQVAYTCKSKLLERVSVLESQFECGHVLGSFLPIEIATGDSDDDETRSKFTEFLQNFKRVEDFSLMFDKTTGMNPYYDVMVSAGAGSRIMALKELCKAREPYYKALFLPVSTLSQLGYDVDETSVDSHDLNSKELRVLKCWLATAQLCQGILRVHVSQNDGDGSSHDEDKESDEKFVEIKFDKAPADVVESSSDDSSPEVLKYEDSVAELTPGIIQVVNKKRSLAARLKKSLSWTKKLLAHHVKVDPSQNRMASHFVDVITRDENDLDSAVAFNGRYDNPGLYSPMRLVADDSDTIFAGASFFSSDAVSIILNSCVAIGLTAVFVMFTVYSSIIASKNMVDRQNSGIANANFKQYFRNKLEERMKAANDTANRKCWTKKFTGTVYMGRT